MIKQIAGIGLAALVAACAGKNLRTATPHELSTGKKPKVEYCIKATETRKDAVQYPVFLQRTFGDHIDLKVICESRVNLDGRDVIFLDSGLCAEKFGALNYDIDWPSPEGERPALFVNGHLIKTNEELCQALGYQPDCSK